MKVTSLGTYRVIGEITSADYDCYAFLEPGDILTIERIDPETGDVWGPQLCDFHDNDIPVEPIVNAILAAT